MAQATIGYRKAPPDGPPTRLTPSATSRVSGNQTTTVWDYENQPRGIFLPSGSRITYAYYVDYRGRVSDKIIWLMPTVFAGPAQKACDCSAQVDLRPTWATPADEGPAHVAEYLSIPKHRSQEITPAQRTAVG
jgi:hypothetical protein